MVLCSPLPLLYRTGIRGFSGVCNYLNFRNSRRLKSREEQQLVSVIGCCSNKTSVEKFALELRSTSDHFAAAPGDVEWSPNLGAGRKISNRVLRLKTLSLGRVMSPQTALSNGITTSADDLSAEKKQQKDRLVVNAVENSDETSEVGRVVSEPLSNGEKLGSSSSSPSHLLNFASLKLPFGESKEVRSQAAEAEFSEDKSPPADEDGSAVVKAGVRNPSSRRVAVIGAGAAGLVAGRELVREGHQVVIYEQGEEVGGVWQYDPRVEDDPLGIQPKRSQVHSSMYHSLRTNLPREVMGYLDYPFLPKEGEGRDGRHFPDHREVAKYLEDFAEDYDLRGLVKFGARVDYVGQQDNRWIVKFQKICDFKTKEELCEKDSQDSGPEAEVFDAVVVCNGHYSQPRLVPIPGVENWPGVQTHSHNYRIPHPFQDKVVVVIGNGNSADDITSEIASLAKEVHQCARGWTSLDSSTEWQGPQHNIWQHTMVTRACSDGSVEFQDGTSFVADVILYCTGYLFSFPFLDTKGYISVEDNRVGPLYKHVFPPALAPALAFVGLPWKVVPFQLMELQSRWIARLLSGKSSLPSESEMMSDIRTLYEHLEATMKFPKSYTHMVGPYQMEYVGWLAEQSGHEPVDTWRKEIYLSATQNKNANPATYRDDIGDQHWYEVARACLTEIKFPSKGLPKASAKETSYSL